MRLRLRLRSLIGLLAGTVVSLGVSSNCRATPDVPLDDWTYIELYRLMDRGLIPTWPLSGLRPLTELRVQKLLLSANRPIDEFLLPPDVRGFWVRPASRLDSGIEFADSFARPYSVPARTRGMVGAVELTCEHREGRPCGDGTRGILSLD